jgi:hypothetical protein
MNRIVLAFVLPQAPPSRAGQHGAPAILSSSIPARWTRRYDGIMETGRPCPSGPAGANCARLLRVGERHQEAPVAGGPRPASSRQPDATGTGQLGAGALSRTIKRHIGSSFRLGLDSGPTPDGTRKASWDGGGIMGRAHHVHNNHRGLSPTAAPATQVLLILC